MAKPNLSPPQQEPPDHEHLSPGDAVRALVAAGEEVAGIVHEVRGGMVLVGHELGQVIWYLRDQLRKVIAHDKGR